MKTFAVLALAVLAVVAAQPKQLVKQTRQLFKSVQTPQMGFDYKMKNLEKRINMLEIRTKEQRQQQRAQSDDSEVSKLGERLGALEDHVFKMDQENRKYGKELEKAGASINMYLKKHGTEISALSLKLNKLENVLDTEGGKLSGKVEDLEKRTEAVEEHLKEEKKEKNEVYVYRKSNNDYKNWKSNYLSGNDSWKNKKYTTKKVKDYKVWKSNKNVYKRPTHVTKNNQSINKTTKNKNEKIVTDEHKEKKHHKNHDLGKWLKKSGHKLQNYWSSFWGGEKKDEETQTETPEPQATEAPMTESPRTAAPGTESPMTESPMTESPMTESPMTESPMTESPMTETMRLMATPEPEVEVPETKEEASPEHNVMKELKETSKEATDMTHNAVNQALSWANKNKDQVENWVKKYTSNFGSTW